MAEEIHKETRPDLADDADVADAAIPQEPGIPGAKTVAEQPDDASERPPGRDAPRGAEPT